MSKPVCPFCEWRFRRFVANAGILWLIRDSVGLECSRCLASCGGECSALWESQPLCVFHNGEFVSISRHAGTGRERR